MTSKAGSVPQFKIDPYYIQKATTDEAISDLLVSLGTDRKKITPQDIQAGRTEVLKGYHRANEVREKAMNRHIAREFAKAERNGTSAEDALDKAIDKGLQKMDDKLVRIIDRKCEACGESGIGTALQKCKHCFTAYYCKKECQTGNWKLHKAEWLKHDEVIKETLVAHQPKFVAPAVTGGFTSELCQLIADYDHYIPKKS
ncbi:MAG: zinc finger MYND domain-containing protein [Chlamydiales bacterium]